MSKHIWRGHSRTSYVQLENRRVYDDERPRDCTVVEDAACFPVKEAKLLAKAATAFMQRADSPNYICPGYGEIRDAVKQYQKAVAKMKAKKKGKK
jgi:hypothetical protein